jgi:RHS repeat-associated protein
MHWRNPRRVRRRASGRAVAYNLRFPGQIFDGQAGLHYNYFRDFDPAVGRYIQGDPLGLQDAVDPYPYAGSDSIDFFDPLGLYKISQCLKGAAAKIKLAVPLAQGAADSLGLGEDFSRTLDYVTFRCMKKPKGGAKNPNCSYNGEPIGTNSRVPHEILLWNNAINGSADCGCLPSTILHEVLHSFPFHYTEKQAFDAERQCFPNCSVTPKSDQDLRKIYPWIR